MNRHVIDKNRPSPTGSRVKNFLSIARMTGRGHPSSLALWRRPLGRPAEGSRMQQYLRIERGHTS